MTNIILKEKSIIKEIRNLEQKFPIFKDKYYKTCIGLSLLSKGEERFGSILVKDRKIVGKGFNRAISHPSFRRLDRQIRQGYANHAEVEALNDYLENGGNRLGGNIYCAGYFHKEKKLFFHKHYSCILCPTHLKIQKIKNIFIPMPDGWIKRPLDEAYLEAKSFRNGTHNNRLNNSFSIKKIENLEEILFYATREVMQKLNPPII